MFFFKQKTAYEMRIRDWSSDVCSSDLLARDWGIRRIAVLEKGYLAGGNTARNTTIIRANYVSPHSVRFYAESMALYRNPSETLDFNILYSERGQPTFAHTDPEIRTCRLRAEVNRHCGVASELIGPAEIRQQIGRAHV